MKKAIIFESNVYRCEMKAKELINKMLYEYQYLCLIKKENIKEAEQFLNEIV